MTEDAVTLAQSFGLSDRSAAGADRDGDSIGGDTGFLRCRAITQTIHPSEDPIHLQQFTGGVVGEPGLKRHQSVARVAHEGLHLGEEHLTSIQRYQRKLQLHGAD